MWLAALLSVALMVLLFLSIASLNRQKRLREPFVSFPETVDLTDGSHATRAVDPTREPVTASYVIEGTSELPDRLGFQAPDPGESDGPPDIRTGGVFVDEEAGVPLGYYAPGTTSRVLLADFSFQTATNVDRGLGPDPDPDSDRDPGADACQGHWTADRRCVYDGDDCSGPGTDRVSLWKDMGATYECVAQEECKTGFWNVTGCTVAGDECEGDDPNQTHVWVKEGSDFMCEAQPICANSWYSPTANACLQPGSACEIRGEAGVVEDRDGGYRCQLTMSSVDGYRLATEEKTVATEDECYLACIAKDTGCSAYSVSGTRCYTAGSSSSYYTFSDPESRIHFTPAAKLYPSFSATEEAAGVRVTWQPFNATGFTMYRSDTPAMDPKEVIPAPGTLVPYESDQTWYFKPEYEMGGGIPSLPIRKYIQTERVVTFDPGAVVFTVEKVPGFHQKLRVVWVVSIEDDMQTQVQYPGTERNVYPHGSATLTFETVGAKTFGIYVMRGGQEVYSATKTAEVACDPDKVGRGDGTCGYLKGGLTVVRAHGMAVTVQWVLEMGEGVTASVFVGDDIVYEDIEPSGSIVEDRITEPGETEIKLVVYKGDAVVFESEPRAVTLACPTGHVFLEGVGCVEECSANPANGEWNFRDDGTCFLECETGYVPYDNVRCVPEEGASCGPGESVKFGAWKADGAGGCRLVCDGPGYFKDRDQCFELCSGTAAPRTRWSHNADNECELVCEDPAFVNRGTARGGCFEECSLSPNANSSYVNDSATGACVLVCDDGYVDYNGACVPALGRSCGHGAVANGEYLADGMGGCVLQCEQGYGIEDEDDGVCKQTCVGALPSGAEFYHNANNTCEIRCANSKHTLYNSGGELSCVLKEGEQCAAVSSGNAIADGEGGCTVQCDDGHYLHYDACVPLPAINRFDVTLDDENVQVRWDVTLPTGMDLVLLRRAVSGDRNGIDDIRHTLGSQTGDMTYRESRPGDYDLTLHIAETDESNGTVTVHDTDTKRVSISCGSGRVFYRGSCVDVDTDCGADMSPVSNGTQVVNADGQCILRCNRGFSLDTSGECSSDVSTGTSDPTLPSDDSSDSSDSAARSGCAVPTLLNTGTLVDYTKLDIGEEWYVTEAPIKYDEEESCKAEYPGNCDPCFVKDADTVDHCADICTNTDECRAFTFYTKGGYLETDKNCKLMAGEENRSTAPYTTDEKRFQSYVRQDSGVSYLHDGTPVPSSGSGTSGCADPTLSETGTLNTYTKLDIGDDLYVTEAPINYADEASCQGDLGGCDPCFVKEADTVVDCADICTNTDRCNAFTFYTEGGYLETGRNCKLMAGETGGVATYAKDDKKFQSYVRQGAGVRYLQGGTSSQPQDSQQQVEQPVRSREIDDECFNANWPSVANGKYVNAQYQKCTLKCDPGYEKMGANCVTSQDVYYENLTADQKNLYPSGVDAWTGCEWVMNNKEGHADTYRSYCDSRTRTSEFSTAHINCAWHADIMNAEFENPDCNSVYDNPIKTPLNRWKSFEKEHGVPVGATYSTGQKEWVPEQETGTLFQLKSGQFEFVDTGRVDSFRYGPSGQPSGGGLLAG